MQQVILNVQGLTKHIAGFELQITAQAYCVKRLALLFGDMPSATAIMDRFLNHADVITITGRCYRLKNRATQAVQETNQSKKPFQETQALPKHEQCLRARR